MAREQAAISAGRPVSTAVLEFEGVDLAYQRKAVVREARLSLLRGQWLALVGPNACGKTTLLRAAAGRLRPARGVVRLDGRLLYPVERGTGNLPAYASAPEDLPPFLTARQSLAIYAQAHGIAAIPEHSLALWRALGLVPYQHELVRHLSLGTRQKLAVVLALLARPSLLLLDEVFNGLDARSALTLKEHLRRLVSEQGLSILLATHALDVVKDYCDAMVLMDSGKLVHRWESAELRGFASTRELERALAARLPPDQP
jgi:ABC-type multidrug transport system ATPase subunit